MRMNERVSSSLAYAWNGFWGLLGSISTDAYMVLIALVGMLFMQADLYNLAPAIGSVNAARQNYRFTMLPGISSNFGSCDMHIDNHLVQPPESARGRIARTYLYFESAYSRYKMSNAQRKLMESWDRQYPVTPSECEIGKRIKKIQHTSNSVLESRCQYYDPHQQFWTPS